jgi:hypothetical protein
MISGVDLGNRLLFLLAQHVKENTAGIVKSSVETTDRAATISFVYGSIRFRVAPDAL